MKEPVMVEFYAAVALVVVLLGWLGYFAVRDDGNRGASARLKQLEARLASLEKRLEQA
jgi:hypothetical protein